jgi:exopolyphosphatase/guanosine-5'-triphosphate,3'-diphosphate pyrophosphatase
MQHIMAALDIGTHSVKMAIVDAHGGVRDWVEVTRLGENLGASGRLDPSGRERTRLAVARFAEIARSSGVCRIASVGTSALRDAADGAEFADELSTVLGAAVEVLSGDREAWLVAKAVLGDPVFGLDDFGHWVVTDVGGGSAEVVQGDGRDCRHRDSLPLGAVRVAEDTGLGGPDPIRDTVLAAAMDCVDSVLASLPSGHSAAILVASGGTATNLAGIRLGCERSPEAHGLVLPTRFLEETVFRLAGMSLGERREIPGLDPARAPVMVAGALVQWRLVARFGCESLRVSVRGLRYGLLAELAEEMGPS